MKTVLKTRSTRKTSHRSGHRRSQPNDGESEQLRMRAAALMNLEVRLIHVAEFEGLDNDDRPIDAAERVLHEIRLSTLNERAESELLTSTGSGDLIPFRNWRTPDPLLEFEQEQVLFRALNLLRFRVNRMKCRLSLTRPSRQYVERIEQALSLVERIRAQLVNSNLRLVTSIARRFASNFGDVDDLSSEGSMILLGSIDRFDYSRGFRFSTYATHSIQRHFYRAWKVRSQRRERFPNASAELLCEVPESADERPVFENPDAIVGRLLAHAETVLDDREHQILIHRFGLMGSDRKQHTLRDIAADLGLSKERVRQLQVKALQKLRDFLELDPSGRDLPAAYC